MLHSIFYVLQAELISSIGGSEGLLVLGADVVWVEELIHPLVITLHRLKNAAMGIGDTDRHSSTGGIAGAGASSSQTHTQRRSSAEGTQEPSKTCNADFQGTRSFRALLSYQERSRHGTSMLLQSLRKYFQVRES